MKRLLILPLLAISLIACEKDDDSTTNDPGNDGNNNPSALTNNMISVGTDSTSLNKYSAYVATDVNTNKSYFDIFIYKDDVLDRKQYMLLHLTEIPTASKTLNWQSGANAPGAIKADEFVIYPKVNDKRWFGVYTVSGYETAGTMQATVNNGKLTLSYEDVELADEFISVNVTERKKCSGKITFLLSDLQGLSTTAQTLDLVAE